MNQKPELTSKTILTRITYAMVGLILGTAANVAISGGALWENSRIHSIEVHNVREDSMVESNSIQVNVILTKLAGIQESLKDIKSNLRGGTQG